MSGLGFTHLSDSTTQQGQQLVAMLQDDLKKQQEQGTADSQDIKDICYVVKIAMDPYEDREVYFQDVSMQMYAKEFAKKYNSYRPPKKVDFIKAWLLELTSRPRRTLCGVERHIRGEYRKHNNNYGFVSEDERNTPQAFSHFTYEASRHEILICDIQGVSDVYTDPQIHSRDGEGFGKGNMGGKGFKKFLSTHRCNAICRYLKLPPFNANSVDIGLCVISVFRDFGLAMPCHSDCILSLLNPTCYSPARLCTQVQYPRTV